MMLVLLLSFSLFVSCQSATVKKQPVRGRQATSDYQQIMATNSLDMVRTLHQLADKYVPFSDVGTLEALQNVQHAIENSKGSASDYSSILTTLVQIMSKRATAEAEANAMRDKFFLEFSDTFNATSLFVFDYLRNLDKFYTNLNFSISLISDELANVTFKTEPTQKSKSDSKDLQDDFINQTFSKLDEMLYGDGPRYDHHSRRVKRGFFDWIFGGIFGALQKVFASVFKIVINDVIEPLIRSMFDLFFALILDFIKPCLVALIGVITLIVNELMQLVELLFNVFIDLFIKLEPLWIKLFKFTFRLAQKFVLAVLPAFEDFAVFMFSVFQFAHCALISVVVYFDQRFYFIEYILVFVYVLVRFQNTLAGFLSILICVLIIGINRSFNSWFVEILTSLGSTDHCNFTYNRGDQLLLD